MINRDFVTARLRSDSGNVLWFIMIGVVLIGLLTVVLSRSSTSVDQSGDVEQLRIMAGKILRTSKSYESAIQDMRLRGVSESDISFQNSALSGYTNAGCTTSECRVFEVGGAGLTYVAPPAASQTSASDWIFTGANNVGTAAGPVGTTAAGTGNDLVMLLPNIRENLCRQINRLLDVNDPNNDPVVDTTGISTAAFTGVYQNASIASGETTIDGDPTPFELDGQSAGCFIDTNATPDVRYFYAVILER